MNNETLLPLIEAVQKATGRRPHLSTCLRWCQRGSSGVRLESRVLGGRRLTSTEAVQRYMNAVTTAKDGILSGPVVSPKQQRCRAARAAKKLAKLVGA